jgi:glycosyltransferase involved in cell wall biosynthesis
VVARYHGCAQRKDTVRTEAPLPPTSSLPWGLPSWRLQALDAPGAAERGAAVRASLGVPPDAFVFVVVAAYSPLKGHRGIAKAFARARTACGGAAGAGLFLVTVGDALGAHPSFFPQEDIAWVRTDPGMRLQGATDAVPNFLAAADAYVSNTLDGGETWGLATLEALAAGVPVLSSSADGAGDMLRDGETALLHDVPAAGDDSEEHMLAINMCRVVEDATLRAELSRRGRAHAREQYGPVYLQEAVGKALGEFLPTSKLRRQVLNARARPEPR